MPTNVANMNVCRDAGEIPWARWRDYKNLRGGPYLVSPPSRLDWEIFRKGLKGKTLIVGQIQYPYIAIFCLIHAQVPARGAGGVFP